MDPDQLRMTIADKIRIGRLPREKCQVTWFGPGLGRRCDACDTPIATTDIECECDQTAGGTIRFHQRCFQLRETIALREPEADLRGRS